MACYGGLKGILSGLTKSTDHPSRGPEDHINTGILHPGSEAHDGEDSKKSLFCRILMLMCFLDPCTCQ